MLVKFLSLFWSSCFYLLGFGFFLVVEPLVLCVWFDWVFWAVSSLVVVGSFVQIKSVSGGLLSASCAVGFLCVWGRFSALAEQLVLFVFLWFSIVLWMLLYGALFCMVGCTCCWLSWVFVLLSVLAVYHALIGCDLFFLFVVVLCYVLLCLSVFSLAPLC